VLIGVISDTHDRLPVITTAFTAFKDHSVDLVVHCGDWKSPETMQHVLDVAESLSLSLIGVLGNNDTDTLGFLQKKRGYRIEEGVLEVTLSGKKCAVYHGHHAPTLRKVKESGDYDIILLGHTHKPKVEKIDNTLLVNPGSTAFAIPRNKEWSPTVMLLDTSSMNVETLIL